MVVMDKIKMGMTKQAQVRQPSSSPPSLLPLHLTHPSQCSLCCHLTWTAPAFAAVSGCRSCRGRIVHKLVPLHAPTQRALSGCTIVDCPLLCRCPSVCHVLVDALSNVQAETSSPVTFGQEICVPARHPVLDSNCLPSSPCRQTKTRRRRLPQSLPLSLASSSSSSSPPPSPPPVSATPPCHCRCQRRLPDCRLCLGADLDIVVARLSTLDHRPRPPARGRGNTSPSKEQTRTTKTGARWPRRAVTHRGRFPRCQ